MPAFGKDIDLASNVLGVFRLLFQRGRCVFKMALAALICASPCITFGAEKLTLCVENVDVRPWHLAQGGGLNIELLNQVARRLDISFEYQRMPWKRCLSLLKNNEVSGVVGGSFKTERLEIGAYPGGAKPDVTKRLNFDRYVVLKRKGASVQWDGKQFQYLRGAVGIQLGYSIGENLRGLGVPVDEGSQRSQDLALKLSVGRLDAAAMLDGEATSLFVNEPKIASHLEVLPVPLAEKPYFLILSRALVASKPELAANIWNAIEEVRNSPAYKKLEHETIVGVER